MLVSLERLFTYVQFETVTALVHEIDELRSRFPREKLGRGLYSPELALRT